MNNNLRAVVMGTRWKAAAAFATKKKDFDSEIAL